MGGRPPLPTNLKVLRGTRRPVRINASEPVPSKTPVQMPKGMPKGAQKVWKQVSRELIAAGVLTNMDGDALRIYCVTFDQWLKATQMVEKYGSVIKADNGTPVLSPWFKTCKECQEQMLKIMREFGMTPSSRSRINATAKESEDDYEQWMRKREIARDGI